ncbi:MAG TPA: hypothetical protein VHZ51_00675 [Ktedonobacteraceae bacterium]|jgi:osmotically-inducible protein OsmY|nr:hypothetical protein [Ktedonobacteraceae bacterium]
MDATLQSAHSTVDELSSSADADERELEEHHIHMPGPSYWPIILGIAILVTLAGVLFIPDAPWLSIVGAPFVLVGILGWALEDPMGGAGHITVTKKPLGQPMSPQVVDKVQEAIERVVTFGTTAYSTHPIKVVLENDNTVLSLYGKVELEAQRDEIDQIVHNMPDVGEVFNFIVAEDAILRQAYAKMDSLRAKDKLEGAQGLSVLVENYILNLYGAVPTVEMKYMLEKEMLGIPGVRVVVNHIGLNKEIPGNLGHTLNKIGGA